MKKLLLYLLLLIWGVAGKPAYATEKAQDRLVVAELCQNGKTDCYQFRAPGEANVIVDTIIPGNLSKTQDEVNTRLDNLEAGRKAGSRIWEKRRAAILADMEKMIDEKMARTSVASWTPQSFLSGPSAGSTVAVPSPTSAPTPVQEASSEASARLELEAQVQELKAENDRLVAEVTRLKSQPSMKVIAGTMETPSWFKWLTILNSIVLVVILVIASWGAAWVLNLIANVKDFVALAKEFWAWEKVQPREYFWQLWRTKQEAVRNEGSLGLNDRNESGASDEPAGEVSLHGYTAQSST